jgi:hypothetical protein
MITTSQKATQKSITLPTLSVQHTRSLFLWASFACHELVRSTTDSWPKTAPAYPCPRSPTSEPHLCQTLAGELRVIAPRSRWTLAPSGSASSASDAAPSVGTTSGEWWRFAGPLTVPTGIMALASTAIERLMIGRTLLGQQDFELLPDGLDEVRWQRGHGCTPLSGSVENSPDDRTSRARFSHDFDTY